MDFPEESIKQAREIVKQYSKRYKNNFKKANALFAGHFLNFSYGFDDAFLGAAKLLEILSKSEKPFSRLFDDVPKTFATPEFKAHTPDDKKFEIVKELADYFTENYDCITLDGVRINFTDRSWGAVRCSNTSPNLTLRFEADSEEELCEIQGKMVEQLKKYPEVNLDWYKCN